MLMLVAILLAVPVLGYFTSIYLINDFNKSLSETFGNDASVLDLCSTEMLAILDDPEITNACQEVLWVSSLETISMVLAVLSIIYVAVIKLLAALAGGNRNLNAQIFPVLVPLSIVFIGLVVASQGAVATFAVYELQVQLAGMWYPVATGGLGLGALIVALSVISAATKVKTKTTMTQRAIVASEEKYPKLWAFVKNIAKATSAPVPTNIVVGLEPNFYATGAEVHSLSDDVTVSGETLYLSLPLMRLFHEDELASVVGHELGHFKGDDISYTLKFAPVYRALQTATTNATEQESLMALPALSMLRFLYDSFEKNEKRISRDREYEADLNGQAASSATSLVSALVKLSVFGHFWNNLQKQVIDSLDYGRPVSNMSRLYADSVAFDTDPEKAKIVALECTESVITHPTDSHPTLAQRMEALGVPTEFLESVSLYLPEDSSASLLPEIKELEEQLSIDEQQFYIALRLSDYESKMPEGDDPYALVRFVQLAAAVMVCADGKVEAEEIEIAESLGASLVNDFNALEFRELCHSPQELPSTSELGASISESFKDSDTIEQLRNYLIAIAESDGQIDSNEQLFIDSLTG
jgi:Zn-dependent protease with chaperone function